MREHQDMAPVMGLMRKHIGEHGPPSRPLSSPAPREFRNLELRLIGQRIGEHAETLSGTFCVGGSSLLHRTAIRIEPSGAFQVRCGIPEPGKAVVVKVREDRSDGASSTTLGSRRLGTPSSRVEMREKKLVHRVIDQVGFQQNISNMEQGFV